jgi:hypothetical protein
LRGQNGTFLGTFSVRQDTFAGPLKFFDGTNNNPTNTITPPAGVTVDPYQLDLDMILDLSGSTQGGGATYHTNTQNSTSRSRGFAFYSGTGEGPYPDQWRYTVQP